MVARARERSSPGRDAAVEAGAGARRAAAARRVRPWLASAVALAQSALNWLMPLSVRGWWTICLKTLKGNVATPAPASAPSMTCRGERTEATSTSDSKPWISMMAASSRIISMPSWLMSSRRPTKGDSSQAPALAARSPWAALKMSVQLVLMPSSAKREMAERPISLMGTLMTMLGAILVKARPSLRMPSRSSAMTSALTGPEVMPQISSRTCS